VIVTRVVKRGTSKSFKLVRWAAIPYAFFHEKHYRAGNMQETPYFAEQSFGLLLLFLVATVLKNCELATAV